MCPDRSAHADPVTGDVSLPELLDNARLRRELGVTKSAADTIMRALPKVEFEGLRKVYVKRADVAELIRNRTFSSPPIR